MNINDSKVLICNSEEPVPSLQLKDPQETEAEGWNRVIISRDPHGLLARRTGAKTRKYLSLQHN